MIRAIAAIDEKRGIASGGHIPWTIPEDSQYFRKQTEHGVVLMGRDTYEEFAEPLSNRRNFVVSRTLTSVRPGFELVSDLDTFWEQTTEDVWIIGGAGLYESTLNHCDELYLTRISGDYNCDKFFPEYADAFSLMAETAQHEQDGHSFTFAVYTKTGKQ